MKVAVAGTMSAVLENEAMGAVAEAHARELWVSLASLLRSYTAAYGLNRSEQATVELSDTRILVRCGERWLRLERERDAIQCQLQLAHASLGEPTLLRWNEEGELETEAGSRTPMDLQAEEWSRELVG